MKRREYTISKDGQILATKNAWNSARREIRKIIREQLLTDREKAELFTYDFKRDTMNLAFVNGSEIWHTTLGRTFVFEIKQVI